GADAAQGEEVSLPPDDVKRYRVSAQGAPARGASRPLVTIVQFSDYECPFCAHAERALDRLVERYPNEVRVVFRHLPLVRMHPDALPAAEAAMEARAQGGDEAFWRMHRLLFANQQALSDEHLIRYAESIGLDVDRFRNALFGGEHRTRIRGDILLARKLGVTGTPVSFVNGRKVTGAKPFAAMEALVRQEIALARERMEEGVPREELYPTLMQQAREEPERSEPPRLVRDPQAVYRVPVDGAPSRGSDGALVTVVELGDFQSPRSKRLQPWLARLLEEHEGDVRVVWMNVPLPFHQQAMTAAETALEAQQQGGDESFWRMHEALFERQRDLSRETILAAAREVGLDATELERALEEREHRETVRSHMLLAQRLGADDASTLFVNGRMLRSPSSYDAIRELVAEERARARAEVESGVPRRHLYRRIVKEGATEPQYVDRHEVEPETSPEPATYELAVPQDAPSRGADGARLVVQVFGDFQCPFCAQLAPRLERLLEEHEEDLRIAWRHYPLPNHEHAALAAEAAVEVHAQGGDRAFWAYHDALFRHQRRLERDALVHWARGLRRFDLDLDRLRRALDDGRHRERVQRDVEAVHEAGMRIGTPAMLVGDRLLMGARSYEELEAAVQAELEASQ
ncbi:MAG: DsbA family protein, partial [Polyangiales bacterium]